MLLLFDWFVWMASFLFHWDRGLARSLPGSLARSDLPDPIDPDLFLPKFTAHIRYSDLFSIRILFIDRLALFGVI